MIIKPTKSFITKTCIALGLGLIFVVSMAHMRSLAALVPGGILDLKIGYNQIDVTNFVNALNSNGLASYKAFRDFDTIYPIIYTAFYGFLLFELSRSMSINRLIMILPAFGMLLDYTENILINMVVNNQLTVTAAITTLMSAVTITKFIFAYASLVTILALVSVKAFKIVTNMRNH